MTDRACFTCLACGLEVDLTEGSESRALFEYHRTAIQSLFATQPDLPLHQDSVAGFLHGFLMAGTYLVPEGSVEQGSMFPVLGGVLLLGRYLPVGPARTNVGRRFMARIAALLGDWDGEVGPACAVVRHAFAVAGDVPMTPASLGGFCLGVIYATPYLVPSGADPVPLIAAACRLAAELN
jgi:hypothetical protein